MRLITKRFGEFTVDPQMIVTFSDGLLGFPHDKRFIVLEHDRKGPFKWLQSLDNTELAFVIVDPLEVLETYSFDLPKEKLAKVGLTQIDDAVIFVVAVIPPAGKPGFTLNLKAPIVVNASNRVGFQAVLTEARYEARHEVSVDEQPKSKPAIEGKEGGRGASTALLAVGTEMA